MICQTIAFGSLFVPQILPVDVRCFFVVAVYPTMVSKSDDTSEHTADESATEIAPLLVIGVTFAPKHRSGMVVSALGSRT